MVEILKIVLDNIYNKKNKESRIWLKSIRNLIKNHVQKYPNNLIGIEIKIIGNILDGSDDSFPLYHLVDDFSSIEFLYSIKIICSNGNYIRPLTLSKLALLIEENKCNLKEFEIIGHNLYGFHQDYQGWDDFSVENKQFLNDCLIALQKNDYIKKFTYFIPSFSDIIKETLLLKKNSSLKSVILYDQSSKKEFIMMEQEGVFIYENFIEKIFEEINLSNIKIKFQFKNKKIKAILGSYLRTNIKPKIKIQQSLNRVMKKKIKKIKYEHFFFKSLNNIDINDEYTNVQNTNVQNTNVQNTNVQNTNNENENINENIEIPLSLLNEVIFSLPFKGLNISK